jgi:DNA-binding MarR family transcriptional regulator
MAGNLAIEGDVADEAGAGSSAEAEHAPLKLEQFLPYQLNVVASLVSQALSRVYARRYRIGVPEWRVLVTLGQYGVMTGKAIGAHTHMHKTKVSRAVALLEKRKLLVRRANRADMRESFLSLTAPGRAMYEELAPHALDFARRLIEILPPGDREAFNRAVKQLTERSAQLVAEVVQRGDIAEDL